MNPPSHVKFVVCCLLIIVLACIGCGTALFILGYQSGELLIGIASGGAGALGGMIAMRSATPTPPGPVQTEVVNPPENPVRVTESKK